MPAFEAIPASALFTSADSNRRSGINAEYFNTANFDGKAHRPAELTYPNSGKMVGAIPPSPKPLFTLPVTFHKSVDQLPAFTDYSMKNRTYRYFKGEPLYPFGYGLSYTSFVYRNPEVTPGREVKVSVEVENTGGHDGDEVIQLYLTVPVRTLAGFRRIALKAKERRAVEFTLLPGQLRGAGSHEISVGGGQPGYRHSQPKFPRPATLIRCFL